MLLKCGLPEHGCFWFFERAALWLTIFVARAGGVAVGMVSLLFTVSTVEGEPATWLEDMLLHQDRRGGRRHVIDWAGARDRAHLAAHGQDERGCHPVLPAARVCGVRHD